MFRGIGLPFHHRIRVVIVRDRYSGGLAPVVINEPVMRQMIQIGREFGGRFVAILGFDQPQPGLMKNLLGSGRVFALAQQITIHRPFVAPV
jgi:hypothetical protein